MSIINPDESCALAMTLGHKNISQSEVCMSVVTRLQFLIDEQNNCCRPMRDRHLSGYTLPPSPFRPWRSCLETLPDLMVDYGVSLAARCGRTRSDHLRPEASYYEATWVGGGGDRTGT